MKEIVLGLAAVSLTVGAILWLAPRAAPGCPAVTIATIKIYGC